MSILESGKANTLILSADSEPYPKRILIDTFIRGLLQIPYRTKVPEFITRFDKFNIFSRILERHYDKLSYTQDWLNAINENKIIKPDICNINNIIDFGVKLKNLRDYDLQIYKLLKNYKSKDVTKWIKDTKCKCSFECALSANVTWNFSQYPKLIKNSIRNIGSGFRDY
jgi:hypothetical protein